MPKPQTIALDWLTSGDLVYLVPGDGNALDWAIGIAESVLPDDRVGSDDIQLAAAAESDGAPAVIDGDIADAALAVRPDGGGESNVRYLGEDFASGAWEQGWSLEATALSDWGTLATHNKHLAADLGRHFGGGNDASDGGAVFTASAGTGSQNSSGDDLIFVDIGSYARPAHANDGNRGGNSGGDDGSDPNVLSEYLSGPAGGYNILIDFKGSWTATLQDALTDAADFISSIIVGDVSDVFFRGEIIDDLSITAKLTEIDGEGGILGQAGPTAIRTSNYLPAVGVMEFDVTDADAFYQMQLWDEIVLHEMLHTVGFGTIWDFKGLVADSGTDNPTFTGAYATSAYEDLFGAVDASGVPLEQDGGSGTAESHWDEETFGAELMTGYLDVSGNYLSGMTVASLEDLGYDTTWTTDTIA